MQLYGHVWELVKGGNSYLEHASDAVGVVDRLRWDWICLQGTRNPFVALFQSRQVSKTGKVTAFISRSTRGMRAVLQSPPHSLPFSMPLAPAGSSDSCSDRHTKELLELGQVNPPPFIGTARV